MKKKLFLVLILFGLSFAVDLSPVQRGLGDLFVELSNARQLNAGRMYYAPRVGVGECGRPSGKCVNWPWPDDY